MSFALLIGSKPASAEVVYKLSGSDYLAAGKASSVSTILYWGFERLRIVHDQDNANRLFVDANFRISDGKFVTSAVAQATQVLEPHADADGGVIANDPLHLTLLTQPFGAVLDLETMAELRSLHAPLPFTSVSPLGGAMLKGMLIHAKSGFIAGFPVDVLRFEADGPIRGTLPNNDQLRLTGIVHLDGVACYRHGDGLLLSLQTELRIDGHVGDRASGAPVGMVYKRFIRAVGQAHASPKADSLPIVKPA